MDKKRQYSTGRGRGRGRGGGGRRGRGLKVGVTVGLRGRRIGNAATTAVANRTGRQRVAQNLVKRAMLQRRRQAIGQRRAANAAGFAGQNEKAQRLLQEVRRWRRTAQVLQTALEHQQSTSPKKVQLRRPGSNFVNAGQNRSPIQNRLGWRGARRGRGTVLNQSPTRPQLQQQQQNRVTLTRGTLSGQMQSDLIAREQVRQQRLTNEILSRALQNIRPLGGRGGSRGAGFSRGGRTRGRARVNILLAQDSVNRRFGQPDESSRFRQVRSVGANIGGRPRKSFRGRGRGGFNSSGSTSDTLNMFRSGSSSGTTLNERFGGSGGTGNGISYGGRRGRSRGRGRSRQYNF